MKHHGIIEIAQHIYWIGVNDTATTLFENLWPIDNGVTYNSYLIVDKKTVLIDCVEHEKVEELLNKKNELLGSRKIDYLVINHIEPDHSGGITLLKQHFPDITIIGNKATFKFLEGYYEITDGLHEVHNNHSLSLGSKQLQFIITPMVHWPETMVTYEAQSGTLFPGDMFGSFGALHHNLFDKADFEQQYLDEFTRYYANVLGKFDTNVKKALKKIESLKLSAIASSHGRVWKSNINKVLHYYHMFASHSAPNNQVMVLYGSMYGNTEKLISQVCSHLKISGIKVFKHHASFSHPSYILRDMFLSSGVVIASPMHNKRIFPPVDYAMQMIERIGFKNKKAAVFGSKTWSAGIAEQLSNFIQQCGWQLVNAPFENLCAPTPAMHENAIRTAQALADALQKTRD